MQIAVECKGATPANWRLGEPIINPIPTTFCGLEERVQNVKNDKNGMSWYLSFKQPQRCQLGDENRCKSFEKDVEEEKKQI